MLTSRNGQTGGLISDRYAAKVAGNSILTNFTWRKSQRRECIAREKEKQTMGVIIDAPA